MSLKSVPSLFLSLALGLLLPFATSATEATGDYEITGLTCCRNGEIFADCQTGDLIRIEQLPNGDFKVLEMDGSKESRSWLLSPRSISTEQLVITARLEIKNNQLNYDESRVTYFVGDSHRQFYQMSLSLQPQAPGQYVLRVRSSQIRETVGGIHEADVHELEYQLSR